MVSLGTLEKPRAIARVCRVGTARTISASLGSGGILEAKHVSLCIQKIWGQTDILYSQSGKFFINRAKGITIGVGIISWSWASTTTREVGCMMRPGTVGNDMWEATLITVIVVRPRFVPIQEAHTRFCIFLRGRTGMEAYDHRRTLFYQRLDGCEPFHRGG